MQRVHIASDHAGFNLKSHIARILKEKGYDIVDHGCANTNSCDYPVFAHSLCNAVEAECGTGILICGSGLGMSMAANRHSGIRAALCTNEFLARASRQHNNANVLCLGERVLGTGLAMSIVAIFLSTQFEGERHQRRLDMMDIPCQSAK